MWFSLICLLGVSGWAHSESSEEHSTHEPHRGVKLIDPRVSSGYESNITEHPYQVSFKIDNTYYCGGVLISEKDIITPSHCTYGVTPDQVVLRAGSSIRDKGVILPVAKVVTHPGYNDPAFDKDIGYMTLAEPVQFSETIQPIALPPRDRPLKGEVLVSGWGTKRGEAIEIPSRVMKTMAHVMDQMRCRIAYPTLMSRNKACSSNFRLGDDPSCTRETDAAAIQDGMVVGLLTFSGVCGHEASPSVFADLAAPEIRDFLYDELGI